MSMRTIIMMMIIMSMITVTVTIIMSVSMSIMMMMMSMSMMMMIIMIIMMMIIIIAQVKKWGVVKGKLTGAHGTLLPIAFVTFHSSSAAADALNNHARHAH